MAGQPRDEAGRFKPGYLRWERGDGEKRWIWWPAQGDELAEYRFLANSGYRMLLHAVVIVVAIALAWFFW